MVKSLLFIKDGAEAREKHSEPDLVKKKQTGSASLRSCQRFGFFYIGNQQSAEVLFRARLFSFSLRNWRQSASQRVESESVLCYSTWDLRKISYIVPPRCVSQRGATD